MELLEIVAQGVQGVPGTARIALGPGVTVLHPADGREGVLTRILVDLLYPQGVDNSLADLPIPGAQQARVGILLQGRDGNAYRILADAMSGKRALMRQEGAQYVPMTQSAAEIAQAVTAQLGFPQQDVMAAVFITRRQDLPSQRPNVQPRGVSGGNAPAPGAGGPKSEKPLPPGFGGAPTPERSGEGKPLPPGFSDEGGPVVDLDGMNEHERRERLAEIKEALATAGKLKTLEFELDGLQKKGFELDERLKPLETLKRSLKQADDSLARFADVARIPGDFPEKVKAWKAEIGAVEREVAMLDDERTKLTAAVAESVRGARSVQDEVKAAFGDPLIRFGTLVGVGAIVIGLIGTVAAPQLRYVAFLDIVGFGAALAGGWRFVNLLESTAGVKRRLDRSAEQQKKLVTKLELTKSTMKSELAGQGVDADHLAEVQERMQLYKEALATKQRAEASLRDQSQGADLATLEHERAGVSVRAKQIEDELFQAGGYLGNPEELRAEMHELEAALAGGPRPEKAAVPAPFPSMFAPEPVAAPAAQSAGVVEDHVAAILKTARDVFLCDLDGVVQRVQARAAQYLFAFSDERYARLDVNGAGEVSVHEMSTGQDVPYTALTPGDRDLVYLAVKLTLAETAARQARLPVVLDRALDGFPDGKTALVARMLQFLGSVTQVFVTTSKPGIAAAAQTHVALP